MVDVHQPASLPPRLSPSHAFGLRRLSARASTASSSSSLSKSTARGLHSFSQLASSLISQLSNSSISLSPGLSELELTRIESNLNFTFPPDLRALLSLALPSSPPFPDWRSLPSLPSLFTLPSTSFLLLLSSNPPFLWPTSSWGPLPPHDHFLSSARSNLRRAPPLIPIFGRFYLPSLPNLAGNPVLYLDETRLFIYAVDLTHFFSSFNFNSSRDGAPLSPLPLPANIHPRWIEFWSAAAARPSVSSRRRSSTSSSDSGPDPERFLEIRERSEREPSRGWLQRYMNGIGSVLRDGGWEEAEVEEMVRGASTSCSLDCEVEGSVVVDAIRLRADRWSEALRRAGWSSAEVADVICMDRVGKIRRVVRLPPEIQTKVDRLAREVLTH